MPPLLLIIGDEEVIRNDSLSFSSRGQEVNDNIYLSLYDTMWHDWPLYYQTSSKQMGIQGYDEIAGFCKGIMRGKTYSYSFEQTVPKVRCNIFLES